MRSISSLMTRVQYLPQVFWIFCKLQNVLTALRTHKNSNYTLKVFQLVMTILLKDILGISVTKYLWMNNTVHQLFCVLFDEILVFSICRVKENNFAKWYTITPMQDYHCWKITIISQHYKHSVKLQHQWAVCQSTCKLAAHKTIMMGYETIQVADQSIKSRRC